MAKILIIEDDRSKGMRSKWPRTALWGWNGPAEENST
jgi:hypothetical protein